MPSHKSLIKKVGILLLFLVFSRPVFAAEYFDQRELQELESLHREIFQESLKEKPQPGAVPPEMALEKLRIEQQQKEKKLWERLRLVGRASQRYSSNVFLERKAKGDFYYQTGADGTLDATGLYEQLGFSSTYTGDWYQYYSLRRLNHYDQSFQLDFPGFDTKEGNLRVLKIGKKITFQASGNIAITQGNYSSSTADQSTIQRQMPISARGTGTYELGHKFSIWSQYQFSYTTTGTTSNTSSGTVQETPGTKNIPYIDHTFQNRLRYRITHKTYVFVGHTFGFTKESGTNGDVTGAQKSHLERITIGAEGKLGKKSTGYVEVGMQRRFYQHAKAKSGYYLQLAYLTRFTRKLSGRITAVHDQSPSSNAGLFTTSYIEANLIYEPIKKITFQTGPYARYNDQGSSDTEGNAFICGINNGLQYRIKYWLLVYANYRFEKQNAQTHSSSYYDHEVELGVRIGK